MPAACDAARDALDPVRLERQLRDDPSRPGKVGSIVAISVFQNATSVAARTASEPEPSCAIAVASGQSYQLNLDIERRRNNVVVAAWREHRVFRRHQEAMEVRSTATYLTEIGREGVSRTSWRVVEDDSYLGTATEDGMLWYRRAADPAERSSLEVAGLGALQALLDAGDLWTGDGATWTTAADGAPLRCTEASEGFGWTDRFVASAQITHGELVASPQRREANIRWILSDGSTLTARLEDSIEPSSEPIARPDDAAVVEVLRDRALARAVELLEKLADRGVAEVASGPETAETETKDARKPTTD